MGQWRWLQRQWWGLDMAWSRWWLGFDRSQQQALLSGLLGADRWALGWLVLAGVSAGLAFGLGLMQRRNGRSVDPPSRDLDALLRQLKRLGIEPEAAETLEALITRTGETFPGLAAPLAALAAIHNERRYAPALTAAAQRQARRRWQLALREVKRWRIDAISPAQGSER